MVKVLKILLFTAILLILALFVYYLVSNIFFNGKNSGPGKPLINPIEQIILNNTDLNGEVDKEKVINESILGFNEKYINYILLSLGVGKLHRSALTFANPVMELDAGEIWSSELEKGALKTKKGSVDNPDVIFKMSKEEAIKALMAKDMKSFMKDSVISGRTSMKMVASKAILFSKGYLKLYEDLKD